MGKDRRVKVPPLKEEGKWRRFFFGSSNNSNSNRRGVRARDAIDAVAAGSGGRKRARLGDVEGAVPEEEQAHPFPVTAAAEESEGEAEQGEFDEKGEVVMEEAAAGDDDGKEEEEAAAVAAAVAAATAAVPVVGPMKEVFEGPHAPGTSLVLQFDQVCGSVRLLICDVVWWLIRVFSCGDVLTIHSRQLHTQPNQLKPNPIQHRCAPSGSLATTPSGSRPAPAWATSRAPGSSRCWRGPFIFLKLYARKGR